MGIEVVTTNLQSEVESSTAHLAELLFISFSCT